MPKTKKKSHKQKTREKGEGRKPNKWADRCMYAELLEMTQDDPWSVGREDGLPDDLESGWVAVAPVPVGKRCLAVTHQSSGLSGIGMNLKLCKAALESITRLTGM
jgi:snurportin-1